MNTTNSEADDIEFVERDVVLRAFDGFAAQTCAALRTMPARLAPVIAVALGVDATKMRSLMENEFDRTCKEITSTTRAISESIGATRQ